MLRLSSLFPAAAALLAAPLIAQDRPVMLNVAVENIRGGVVDGIPIDAFIVKEDGVSQRVLAASQSDAPVSLGILIDNGSTMADKRHAAVDAARALMLDTNPRNEIFVVNYNDKARLDQTLTSNRDLLEAAIAKMSPQGGAATFDAIAMADDYLRREGKNHRKALVVISANLDDTASKASFEELLRHARLPDGVVVYGLGVLGNAKVGPVRAVLTDLARASGGLVYFPDEYAIGIFAERLAARIRFRYEVLYLPTNPNFDGKLRTVTVNLIGSGFYPVLARNSYIAEWSPQ